MRKLVPSIHFILYPMCQFLSFLKSIIWLCWECFPGGSDGKESACNAGDLGSIPGLGRSPGGGHGNPLQYSWLENPHGQRSLTGCSPWGHKELDTNEWLSTQEGLSYSRWDLVPWPEMEPRTLALGTQSLSHWTSMEVPLLNCFNFGNLNFNFQVFKKILCFLSKAAFFCPIDASIFLNLSAKTN